MNEYWKLIALGGALVLVGCDQGPEQTQVAAEDSAARVLDRKTFEAGLDPQDERIVAFVAWLKERGVELETAEEHGRGWWRVVKPKVSGEFDVSFSLRSFPAWATDHQMQSAIGDVNLAYQLNAPARLAMSYGGYQGKQPAARTPKSEDELPKVDGLPVTKAVEQLFLQYQVEKAKTAGRR